MTPLHPAFVYGPHLFIALSVLLSARLAPRLVARIEARRRARHAEQRARARALGDAWIVPFETSPSSYLVAVALSLVLVWSAGSVAGGLALLLAETIDETDDPTALLPGERFDGFVVAHAVPPLAALTVERMIERIVQPVRQARFRHPEDVERRMARATSIDPQPERALDRLLAMGFRSRAGRVAMAQPTPKTCQLGLSAAAAELSALGVENLARVCRSVPGDVAAPAFFALGDFRQSTGQETEAILSRLPFAPPSEPGCQAGGDTVPEPSMPLCRLLHAEVKRETREAIVRNLDPGSLPPFARRWRAGLAVRIGEPLDRRFELDPLLVWQHPAATLQDHPIALAIPLAEPNPKVAAPDRANYLALLAAHQSAFGSHEAARRSANTLSELQSGLARDEAERARVAALIAVVHWRASRAEASLEVRSEATEALISAFSDLPRTLKRDQALARLGSLVVDPAHELHTTLAGNGYEDCAGLPERLSQAEPQLLLRDPPIGLEICRGDPALAVWMRQFYPPCEGCEFQAQVEYLTRRRDMAEAMGDAEFLADISLPLARFRAVVENRPLGLVLAAGRPLAE